MNILNYNNQAKTQSMCQMKLFSWMCPTLKKCTKPRFCWMQNSADRLESWAATKSDAWLHRGDRFSNFFPDIFTMQQKSISRNPVEKSSPYLSIHNFFLTRGFGSVKRNPIIPFQMKNFYYFLLLLKNIKQTCIFWSWKMHTLHDWHPTRNHRKLES